MNSPESARDISIKKEEPEDLSILYMVASREEVSPKQESSPSLKQEEPEPTHIKKEPEELLLRPEEPVGSMLTLLTVKREVDEDISSHSTTRQKHENTDQPISYSLTNTLTQPESLKAYIDFLNYSYQPDIERPFHCTQCNKSFKLPGGLKRHQLVHAGKTKIPLCKHRGKSLCLRCNRWVT